MASERTKLEIVNESPKNSNKAPQAPDINDLEMIFGKPYPPNNNSGVHFINNEKSDSEYLKNADHQKEPLLEPDRDPQKPPLAGPEMDDLDDETPNKLAPFPGIDDGLLDLDKKPEDHNQEGDVNEGSTENVDDLHSQHDGENGTDDGKWLWPNADEPDYPYGGTLDNRFGIDDPPISPAPGSAIDVNTYQQKKNLAQGMMDLALLSANANQLRYVLESATAHPYYYPSLTLITLSIIFQIAVGVGLIMNSRYDVKDKEEICKADKINNMTVLGIFLITIVNVFITSFSVATPTITIATAIPQQTG